MPPFENDTLSGLYGLSIHDDDDDDDDLLHPFGGGGEKALSPVPLIGVQVEAQTLDFIARVKLSQSYRNDSKKALEAIYHFPIYDGAAICGFEAEYEDGRRVKGVVKEKKVAKQEYTVATQQGKQANLLESIRRDVFTLKVGNLPPGGFVKISITYVLTLEARDEDAIALVLPMSIAPRYTPGPHSRRVFSLADDQALTPPATAVKWFGLVIHIDVTCRSGIKAINCPTHSECLRATTNGTTGYVALNDITMDRDVVIMIQEEKAHQPRASVEISEDGTMTGFVTFYPKIEFPDEKREFVFVVDQSGSMGGQKIVQAREALLLFLRSLPPSCTFNIVGFGSTYRSLFAAPQPYNDKTLQIASGYVSSMEADLGGTEIVSPLNSIFRSPRLLGWHKEVDKYSGSGNYINETTQETSWEKPKVLGDEKPVARQVFVLTDGQVSNDVQVFDLVRQYCSTRSKLCRLFSVGIGASASRHLVTGMARAGRGTSSFVEDGSTGDLRVKVLGQLKQALQPSLDDVTIEWKFPQKSKRNILESLAPPNPVVKTLLGYRSPAAEDEDRKSQQSQPYMYPSMNPPIFSKDKYLSFAMFPQGCSGIPEGVTVKCETMDGPLLLDLKISENEVFHGSIARKLAARVAISESEDTLKGSGVRRTGMRTPDNPYPLSENEALRLALDNNLVSDKTSFLAISEGPVVDPRTSRHTLVVPQQASRDFDSSLLITRASSERGSSSSQSGGASFGGRLSGRGRVHSSFRDRRPGIPRSFMVPGCPPMNAQPLPPAMPSAPFSPGPQFCGTPPPTMGAVPPPSGPRFCGMPPPPKGAVTPPIKMAGGATGISQPLPMCSAHIPPGPQFSCPITPPAPHHQFAGFASPTLHRPGHPSCPPPPPQAQRQQQHQNRAWDDVPQRWVEVETKAGWNSKSAHMQSAVAKRVNEMTKFKTRALKESRREFAKFDQHNEVELQERLEQKIKKWSDDIDGKKKHLRYLLATLDSVLWSNTKCKPLGCSDLLEDSKVKRAFHKATREVHPDKTEHLPSDHRYLAKRILDILCKAKTDFDHSAQKVSGLLKKTKITADYDGKKLAGDEKMIAICMLQKADGSFVMNKDLFRAVDFPKVTVDEMIARLGCQSAPTAFATALAVVTLRVEFSNKRKVWGLQEQKALTFLTSEVAVPEDVLSKIEAEVCRALHL